MTAPSPNDGLCLKYPEHMPPTAQLSYESAVSMLQRAVQLAHHTAFHWGFIDKPSEGQLFLIFQVPQLPLPIDGIRYQDQEQKAVMAAGQGRELEVTEIKFGFIPNSQDTTAWRVRRRFRLTKGGHPSFVLIHYSRGQPIPIMPQLNQPVRVYPLRGINEPPVLVFGDKGGGTKMFPGQPTIPGERQQPMPFGVGIPGNTQAILAQQNNSMDALERRSQAQRGAQMPMRQQAPRVDDDDSADESDLISTRTLALTRYRRNHDYMNEVFMFAAFGRKKDFKTPPPPYSIFKKDELEAKVAKLTAEIERLQEEATAREEARRNADANALPDESADVSMDDLAATANPVVA